MLTVNEKAFTVKNKGYSDRPDKGRYVSFRLRMNVWVCR